MEMISPLELRVAELMHHMKIESAVADGAKNVVKQLSGRKIQDRRILAEVGTSSLAPGFRLGRGIRPPLCIQVRNTAATKKAILFT